MNLNLSNLITLSRIPLMFLIAGLMFCGWPGSATAAFLLFLVAATGDWLDGYLARKHGWVTTFGKLMDALTDKIMVMGLVIAFVGSPQFAHSPRREIAVALALITLSREFLVTGIRMVAASKGVVVPADGGGKTKTVTQLVALGFLLSVPMVTRDWTRLTAADLTAFAAVLQRIGEYLFVLCTAIAVWSGWRYVNHFKALVLDQAD